MSSLPGNVRGLRPSQANEQTSMKEQKRAIEEYFNGVHKPQEFPTISQLAEGIGFMPAGLTPDMQKPYIRRVRETLKWAEQVDPRFHIYATYIADSDVRGWRIANGEISPILIVKHQIQAMRTARTWGKKAEYARRGTTQYKIDHPENAELVDTLIAEMEQVSRESP